MARLERKQQERGLVTRDRLIQATLDEICAVGYHAATTPNIALRADVSRGALMHHFPTRTDLILAAMETLLENGTAEIRAVAGQVGSGTLTLEDFVEFLWTLFSGRFFYLSLELITEARNDAALRERMIPVVKRFHDALDALWVEFCDGETRPARQARIILNLTVCMVRGMGVQTVLRPERGYYRDLIEAWKGLVPHLVSGEAGDVMFSGEHFQLREPG